MRNKKGRPANKIQDLQFFGEFGGVNPSIADSSTFTYLVGKTMGDVFEEHKKGVTFIHDTQILQHPT